MGGAIRDDRFHDAFNSPLVQAVSSPWNQRVLLPNETHLLANRNRIWDINVINCPPSASSHGQPATNVGEGINAISTCLEPLEQQQAVTICTRVSAHRGVLSSFWEEILMKTTRPQRGRRCQDLQGRMTIRYHQYSTYILRNMNGNQNAWLLRDSTSARTVL